MTHESLSAEPSSLAAKSARRLTLETAAAAFLILFLELVWIRWLPGQVRVLAYFPNLILISAFLGIGIGCLLATRRSLLAWWPVSVLAIAVLAVLAGQVVFTQGVESEVLWLLYYDLPKDAPVVHDVRPPIAFFFAASAVSFVPLGQLLAQRLEEFRVRAEALRGYRGDLLGSLAGVVAFSIAGFAGTFPVFWFAVLFAAGAIFFATDARRAVVYAVLALSCIGLVHRVDQSDHYSPYYSLRTVVRADGVRDVLANGSLHQAMVDLREPAGAPAGTDERFEDGVRRGFRNVYDMLPRAPRRVLVVGAGTGNDVAKMLELGAEHIDAVEIDPKIIEIGRAQHPNRPYDSPKVHVHNTDGRAFLQRQGEPYDLIVFGTLDSMTRLSALSSVRLDTFIYTVESLRAARARLAPDGGLVLLFRSATDYIDDRLPGILTTVFGQTPVIGQGEFFAFNRAYLAGPAFESHWSAERRAKAASARADVDLPTDDWPFLYLRNRGVSPFYLSVMGLLALIALAGVLATSPDMRRSLLRGKRVDGQMFLFGLAFLLLETRAVTEMNLVWGATWITSAVVFGAILVTLILATLLTERVKVGYGPAMGGLLLSLLATYLLPTHVLLADSVAAKLLLSTLFVGTPIAFAGICFAIVFRQRPSANLAFGWNLLGAVAGGLLELTSMALGLRPLLLVAALAYLGALLLYRREQAGGSPAPVATAAESG